MVRAFSSSDHSTLAEWWTAQKWPTIPLDFLPSTGFVVDGLCAGFLYRTDSSIAWLEWVVANPAADKTARREALDELVAHAIKVATAQGYKALFSSASHPGLIERYKKHGFVVSDVSMSNLIRGL